jgi:hypothetical protein
MAWDREKWTREHIDPERWGADAETPTAEKERAALDALRDLASEGVGTQLRDGSGLLVNTEAVISRNYKRGGEHIAHAHWLADLLDARGVEVWGRTLFKITPETAAKLAAPFESYEATD